MGKLRFDRRYKIISNKQIAKDYFELKIEAKEAAQNCRPGQFFMITAPGFFLRRPFSIYDAEGQIISFLYKAAGKGTKTLSEIKNGQIDALGPLGNGYLEQSAAARQKGKTAILIAGGTGIASLFFLAKTIKEKIILFYGAKAKNDLLRLNQIKKFCNGVFISTEDGSVGKKGFITKLLEKNLNLYTEAVFYICGPSEMIKSASAVLKRNHLKGFASLEEKMACGLGNCQGCAVKTKDGIE
ncbi:MAG: dihydroorotate dehydrogenase electron transfer subunit, partial [Elusimicrobiota bacterium]|nr:dihydroorotate dehydrogenase electron transfer subunit [Elusimicrobiota bacterium]